MENKKSVLKATEGKEIKSKLTGNRDAKMIIKTTSASGKHKYRNK